MKGSINITDWDAAFSAGDPGAVAPAIKALGSVQGKGYATDYAFVNVPHDTSMHDQVLKLVAAKKKLNPVALVVIGIGGSNLGTKAVHEVLHGVHYNELTDALKIYFADTTDPDMLADIICLLETHLKNNHSVILNVISKSGATTETITNFYVLFDLLRRYKKDAVRDCVVITTDEGSALWGVAHQEGFATLPIAKKIGGRFSVLSPVGLFPLAMIGVDIAQLCAGAECMTNACVQEGDSNPAARSAAIMYAQYKNDIRIHNMFLFSVALESVGKWYRQLVGESLGKELDLDGKQVRVGITPTVAIGSVDLHSLAQLYLGGPFNTFTTFVSLDSFNNDQVMPSVPALASLVPGIENSTISHIMQAILGGVKTAYRNDGRPFLSVHMPKKSAYAVGQLLQWKMIETVYLAHLLNINPFDQPSVELYKRETRKILSHG